MDQAFDYIRDAVTSELIQRAIVVASSFIDENLLPRGLQSQLNRLNLNIPMIKSVLIAIENGVLVIDNNDQLNLLLRQFKDALEVTEDVLDELEYREIEKLLQARDSEARNCLIRAKRKFSDFITGWFSNSSLNKLTEVVARLDDVSSAIGNFVNIAVPTTQLNRREDEEFNANRETTGVETDLLLGRENETELVINWLISASLSVDIFTIIGDGGMGKSTLAKVLYNNQTVRDKFDFVMWVCVSNRFDVVKITRIMLEAIKERNLPQSLNALQETLKEKLVSKKFLLVLDDVWSDDKCEWDKLIAPLKFGQDGSKILVTTRMDSVAETAAKTVEKEKKCVKLGPLSYENCLLLFNTHAFAGVDHPQNYMMVIGSNITKKLGGFPLAAKVIGANLNSKDRDDWEKVLEEDTIINVDNGDKSIMPFLRLSYQHLPTNLQRCFRYCSIFPQDYVFERCELIYMWIASGLIQDKRGQLEVIGRGYIDHLVRKSFFEVKESKNSTSYYVMHDLLHDLAYAVSAEECLRIDGEEAPTGDFLTIRHMYVCVEPNNESMFSAISKLKGLRTLVIDFKGNDSDQKHVSFLNEVLNTLKSLRLLSLTTSFSCKLPDIIGSLIHLRYLSIQQTTSDSTLNWFPKPVYNLYHLTIMRLLGGSYVGSGGINVDKMTNLINLRYLEVPQLIINKIPYIGRLTSLQGSLIFHVRKEKGYKIRELKNLVGIRNLSILDLQNVNDCPEVREINLFGKKNLKSLSLVWFIDPNRGSDDDQNTIEKLQPNLKIREITIEGYNGVTPCWMINVSKFTYLTSISLVACAKWENLPTLGQLPLLEFLEIRNLPALRRIGESFYGVGRSFQSLCELRFHNMEHLTQWIETNGGFNLLDMLRIENCPSLRNLPRIPFNSRRLHLKKVGFDILPELHIDTRSQEQSLLEELQIKYCQNLNYLQPDGFKNLRFLKILHIGKCPNLTTGRIRVHNFLPSTIEYLSVGPCGTFEIFLLNSLAQITSLKSLSLEECANVTNLPSTQVLATLTTLKSLKIKKCTELKSLQGLEAIPSLDSLTIVECEKLVTGTCNSNLVSKIKFLNIDKESLLSIEPLRRLTSIVELKIGYASQSLQEQWLSQNRNSLMEIYIYDLSSLSSLPPSFANFASLKRLNFCNATRVVGPLTLFPTSLRNLHICGCDSSLINPYRNGTSFIWDQIPEDAVEIIEHTRCIYEPMFMKELDFNEERP